ncbi:hypothetical protein [Caballeronia sp. LjRoot31]|uniref:hypothetical protein n=1 Tax=Caballeronia sp. LjRoot31 TaxID=3342324 RepID=UPI003ECE3808
MDAVLRAILHDQHAGRAGVYRFDPSTGQRTPLTGSSCSTNPPDVDEPVTPAIEVDHEPGQSDTPDNGATQSDFSDS